MPFPQMISGKGATVILHEIWYVNSHENHCNCCHQMSDFKAKMHKIQLGLSLPLTPLGELTALPDP